MAPDTRLLVVPRDFAAGACGAAILRLPAAAASKPGTAR